MGNFGFSYDDARRRTGLTFPNSHTGAYTYDTVSRPTGVTWNTATPSLIASQTNVWNSVGNISSSTTTHGLTGTRTYGYDQNNRLTSRTTTGSLNSPHPALTWNLDVVGNRTSTVLNGVTTSYSLNGAQLNQYGTIGGASQTWDTRGNLLTDGTRSLTYDADNRLIQAVSGATTCTYTYDFAHRMASRLETGGNQIRMIYDQNWNVIATISGSTGSILQKFIHGPQVDELLAQVALSSSSTYYLTKDHLGSTTALVRASTNAVVERYTCDEYGAVQVWDASNQPVSTNPLTRTLFTGREYQPATGLYHYRHRWYHPGIGRFVSPDPIGFAGGDVNWYTYVGNNSLRAIDPKGLSPSWQPPRELGQGQPGFDEGFNDGAGNAAKFCAAALGAWAGAGLLAEYAVAAGIESAVTGAMAAGGLGATARGAESAARDLKNGNPVDVGDAIEGADGGALGGICAFAAGSAGGGEIAKKVADVFGKLFR